MHKRILLALLTLDCSSHALASAEPVPVPITVDDDLSVIIPAPEFTLWQLQTPHVCGPNDKKIACHQMNSYVIRTGVQYKVIVIDGGMPADAAPLTAFLQTLGNHVDMWFVSHQHPDHIGALTQILQGNSGPQIARIYGSLLTTDDVPDDSEDHQYEPGMVAFESARANTPFTEVSPGQTFVVDGLKIEILGAKNPTLVDANDIINNSSVVMRVSGGARSVLFTGDLGSEGADMILGSPHAAKLKSEYLQMAHHGNGANADFYEAVSPKYCLWPTTKELWDIYTDDPTLLQIDVVRTPDKCGPTTGDLDRHFRAFDPTPSIYAEIP